MKAGAARNGRPPSQDVGEARSFQRAAGLILLFNGLLVAWVLLKPGSDRMLALVVNTAEFVGPLLALPLCFGGLLRPVWRRGASQTDVEPAVTIRQRWAPILLGLGIISWVLGQAIFTYYEWVLDQPPPLPSIADVGYLSVYPFLLLGILLLPARPVPVASRTRIALDGLMTMTAAVTFSWYFVLGPVMQQGTQTMLAKAVATAYPLADIVLIACLVILALRPGEHTLRLAIRLLALGLVLVVVADSNFAYLSLHDAYATGMLLDVGWSLGYMLVALGAFAARLAPTGEAATTTPDEPGDTSRSASPLAEQRVWHSLLPYVLVPAVGILVVYAWRTSAGSGSLALGVYLGGAVLIGLVLLRQVLTIVENARLYNRLQGTYRELEKKEEEVRQLNKDLEKRVAERTEQLKSAMAKQQQEAQERERIEQELRVARLIQHTLLPKSAPELEGHHIAVYYQPAREVGGDFYDFLDLEDGRLGLIVGDVSGKGVPAAIVMAITRTMLRAAYRLGSPGEILEQANNILYPEIPPNMFVTCLAALLDSRSGRLHYANAGHDLPYLRHAEGGSEELRATGMPLGLMPNMSYEQKEITLEPGESVLLYSDGLVEAHDPQREMFGFPRMQGFVGAHPDAATLIDSLLAELERFTGEEWEQEDDITLLTLKRFRS